MSCSYLTKADIYGRYVQCPTWGWPTEGAYYRDASSVDAIYGVRIPLLAIHAEDDPVILVLHFLQTHLIMTRLFATRQRHTKR